MSKLIDFIETNNIEKYIVYHEFGHLFTSVLFKSLDFQYNIISRIEFFLYENQPQARVNSVPLHSLITNCNKYRIGDISYLISKEDKALIGPVILGLASGNMFDAIFSNKGDFLEILWSKKLMPHQDRDAINCIRKMGKLGINELENFLNQYKTIIEKHKKLIDTILYNLCLFEVQLDEDIAFFSDRILIEIIEYIEFNLPRGLVADVQNFRSKMVFL